MKRCLLLIGLLIGLDAQATKYYVGAGGSDSNNGTSWATRFLTITKGVQTATSPGDIVEIGDANVYNESLNNIFPSGSSGNLITLQTTNGLRATLRPAAGADWVIQFASAQTEYYRLNGLILDGTNVNNDVMKITSGSRFITSTNCDFINSPDGHGTILSTADGFRGSDGNNFYNCRFGTNGILHYGGGTSNHGVYNRTDSNLFDGCLFTGNQDHGLQGSSQPSHTIVRNCKAWSNPTGIGFYTGTNNWVYNCLVYSNNIGIRGNYQAQGLKVQNNTCWKNGVNISIDANITGWALVENNILAQGTDTTDGGGLNIYASGQQVTNRNNLSYGNATSNYKNENGANTHEANNLFGNQYDALFTDAANGDFTIGSSSSARNTGITISAITTDFAGTARPQESVYDIGAYERSAGGTTPTIQVNATTPTALENPVTPGVFTISRDITTASSTVNYQVAGTAINGTDYNTIATNITLGIGVASGTVTITPVDDPTTEGDETVILNLWPDAAYTLSTPTNATVTIVDNDQPQAMRWQKPPGVGKKGR